MPKGTISPPLRTVQPIPFLFDADTLIRIVDLDGNPWFLVEDLKKIIGPKNTTNLVKKLPEDERLAVNLQNMNVNRGNPKRIIVSESGMYALVLRGQEAMRPDTPAFKFRRWVTGEVLPTIRKSGHYEIPHIEPKPREMSIPQRRHMVNTAHRLGGVQAGIELWNKLGLPELEAFKEIMRQGRFNFTTDLDNTPAPAGRYVN